MTGQSQAAGKPVITIFESYGAGARTVGPRVAAALEVPFLGQKYSSEEIEDTELVGEGGFVSRVLRSLGRVGVDAAAGGLAETTERTEALANVRQLRAAAAGGVVVVGRNATVVLADLPGVLHVKLDGPVEDRVARAAADDGLDPAVAARRQAREDRVRAEMSMRLHNWDPRHNERFDLVVNTSTHGLDIAVEIILAAYAIVAGSSRG